VGASHNNIAFLLFQAKDYPRCIEEISMAVAIHYLVDPDSRRVPAAMSSLGEALEAAGQPDRALATWTRTLALYEKLHGPEHRDVAGVIPGARRSPATTDEDRRDGVPAGVTGRIRVGVELAHQRDVEARLFPGFPDGRRFQGLAVLDEAAGQGPAERRVPATDQHDGPRPHLDDHVDRDPDVSGVGGHPAT
jgi:hypothetical protein